MFRHCVAAAAASALALLLAASAADAQVAKRAWVSGHGTDSSGCGAPTAPCRSLQWAHDHIVAAGGEIDILDPAGYGAVVITKAISIVNDGVGTAGLQANIAAVVSINAGASDTIRLRGLNIEGLGSASTGIDFRNGGWLQVADGTVDGAAIGILYEPSGLSQVFLSNLRVTNSVLDGVLLAPAVTSTTGAVQATLDRLDVVNTTTGAGVSVSTASSGSGVYVTTTLADSVIVDNHVGVEGGATSSQAPVFLTVRNSTISNNTTAMFADQYSTIDVTHSTISGNALGFVLSPGGTLNSFGDNSVDQNIDDGVAPTPIAFQ